MAVNTQKNVRVLAGPTGPTGAMQGVRVLANFTGPTGLFPQWQQLAGATGPTGTFETVYAVGATAYALAAKGTIKTVIIPGYTGPA